MFGLGPVEVVVIGAIAVMLYGKRLPEVGRSVGQTISELRKQMTSLSREMDLANTLDDASARRTSRRIGATDDGPQATGPRFEPPAPAEETAAS
ncbi:MAG: twin-arginine translocase TatA/TatE family subunit [Planctomycetia bacterium]|nr:twin-arginine translocase TatA/TatE family subunit [Planctomycetia bacterium]